MSDSGALAGLAPKKRGPATKVPHPLEGTVAALERELARATRRAERAEGLAEQGVGAAGDRAPKPDEAK